MEIRISYQLLCQFWLLCVFSAEFGVAEAQDLDISFDENILLEIVKDLNNSGSDQGVMDNAFDFANKPCSWVGVVCSSLNRSGFTKPQQVVTYLSFPRRLRGRVPGRLGTLAYLETLYLIGCDFTGSIPPELFNATSLKYLSFEENYRLSGSLPMSIGKLQKLTSLSISYTNVRGTLETVEQQLNQTSMTKLDLSFNNMTGDLYYLQGFTRLTELTLSGSQFMGANLSFLQGMEQLYYLYLAGYKLGGDLTPLQNLTNLIEVDLDDNELTGSLLPLQSALNLTKISLSGNSVSGDLSPLKSLTSVSSLDLTGNQLAGDLNPLRDLFLLGNLLLSKNRLTGDLTALRQLDKLSLLDMGENRLNGSLSSFLVTSTTGLPTLRSQDHLYHFSLAFNNFTGEIPPGLIYSLDARHVYSTVLVNLSGNSLIGSIPIPPEVWLTDVLFPLITLDLSHNMLESVDQWVNDSRTPNTVYPLQFSVLRTSSFGGQIFLDHNKLSGPIESFPQNAFLVDLSHNNLSGRIPGPQHEAGQSGRMTDLLLSYNYFTGPIPPGLGKEGKLKTLDLSHNMLSGALSDDLFEYTLSLQTLNLSANSFYGFVPERLATLAEEKRLQIVDLSNNNFTGRLPEFPTVGNFTYRFSGGNQGLCTNETMHFELPACPPAADGGAKRRRRLVLSLGLSLASLLVIAVGGAVFLWHRQVRRNTQMDFQLVSTVQSGAISCHLIPFRDLRKATNNFSPSAEIGGGAFGTVYKGELDGREVALKRSMYEVQSPESKAQFMNEVQILSMVNHRNLVSFVGCCLTRKEAILVFEYMPRGTLAEHLHRKIRQPLDWNERLNIAISTAEALSYLHSAANPPIFHRDVKSANILLDDRLDAKVADFGISKLVNLDMTHVTTMRIQGTPGYIDPEYYYTFQLTDKSDVYSYGVVLLELITAQAPVDHSRGDRDSNLVHMASHLIKTDALQLMLDPTLITSFTCEVAVRESIMRVGRLALRCVEVNSTDRPTMKDIWSELVEIRAQQPIDRPR